MPTGGGGGVIAIATASSIYFFDRVQWKVIRSVLVDRQDNCVIMATGRIEHGLLLVISTR